MHSLAVGQERRSSFGRTGAAKLFIKLHSGRLAHVVTCASATSSTALETELESGLTRVETALHCDEVRAGCDLNFVTAESMPARPRWVLRRMTKIPSFRDWYRDGPLAATPQAHRSVVSEEYRAVDAGPVHMINMSPPAGAVVDPPVPEYAVHLVLQTPPLIQVGFNSHPRWLVMSPGVILVAPPDTAGDFIADGPSHVLTITIPKAHVENFTQDSSARIEVRREETFRDPRLMPECIPRRHTVQYRESAGRLFRDQLRRQILQTLARPTET